MEEFAERIPQEGIEEANSQEIDSSRRLPQKKEKIFQDCATFLSTGWKFTSKLFKIITIDPNLQVKQEPTPLLLKRFNHWTRKKVFFEIFSETFWLKLVVSISHC